MRTACIAIVCLLAALTSSVASADAFTAAGKGNGPELETYLDNGGDANAQDSGGYTPLHYAAIGNHVECVQLLLAHKANVNLPKRDGVTPLHIAASMGWTEIARILVAAGAAPHAKDDKGRTPVSLATQKGRKEILALLTPMVPVAPITPPVGVGTAPVPTAVAPTPKVEPMEPPSVITYRILALVDGTDELVIQGDKLRWRHRRFQEVGRFGGANEPTTVSTAADGDPVIQDRRWIPQWHKPEPVDAGAQSSSSELQLNPPLPKSDVFVTLETRKGPGFVGIMQHPTEANNHQLRVLFDDTTPEASWYEVVITVRTDTAGRPKQRVALLVERAIYPAIQAALAVFAGDLLAEGYQPVFQVVDKSTRPDGIRRFLQALRAQPEGLCGCFLVGDLPAAYVEFHTGDFSKPQDQEVFVSLDATDQYYGDLDGSYEHTAKPRLFSEKPDAVKRTHVYDSAAHLQSEYIVRMPGDRTEWPEFSNKLGPALAQYRWEIWVARIMGHNLVVDGRGEADILNAYFACNHAYRTGQLPASRRAVLVGAGEDPTANDQGMDYAGVFDSMVRRDRMTRDEYLKILGVPEGNQLVYITAHTCPSFHCMFDRNLSSTDLAATAKTGVFYILNACSSCRWDQYKLDPAHPMYVGGAYVFAKSNGTSDRALGAIGFTGVGGFNMLGYFAEYLRANADACYGEAFLHYVNRISPPFILTNYVFLGDPTIRPRANTVAH